MIELFRKIYFSTGERKNVTQRTINVYYPRVYDRVNCWPVSIPVTSRSWSLIYRLFYTKLQISFLDEEISTVYFDWFARNYISRERASERGSRNCLFERFVPSRRGNGKWMERAEALFEPCRQFKIWPSSVKNN